MEWSSKYLPPSTSAQRVWENLLRSTERLWKLLHTESMKTMKTSSTRILESDWLQNLGQNQLNDPTPCFQDAMLMPVGICYVPLDVLFAVSIIGVSVSNKLERSQNESIETAEWETNCLDTEWVNGEYSFRRRFQFPDLVTRLVSWRWFEINNDRFFYSNCAV